MIEYAAKRLRPDEVHLLCYYRNGIEQKVDIDRVIYFCSNHRVIEYKGIEGIRGIFYQQLDVIEELLQEQYSGFIRIGKSFLVNRKYIIEQKGSEIFLINGERLFISRRYRKKQKKVTNLYKS